MTEPTTPLARDVTSADAMRRLGAAFAACLGPGAVVALSGELGAGKTQFIKGVAAGLGIAADSVTSPMFTLMHVYDCPATTPAGVDPSVRRLVHLDAYRLGDAREASELGLDDELGAVGTVACVEWPERLGALLPADRFEVVLAHVGADRVETRRATLARVDTRDAARACALALWARDVASNPLSGSEDHAGH